MEVLFILFKKAFGGGGNPSSSCDFGADHLTSLCLSFLNYKMGIITAHMHRGCTICSYHFLGLKLMNSSILPQPSEVGPVILPILEVERLRQKWTVTCPRPHRFEIGKPGLESQKSGTQIYPVNFQDTLSIMCCRIIDIHTVDS